MVASRKSTYKSVILHTNVTTVLFHRPINNGACTAKVGLSKATSPKVIPNCIMKAKSERRRPFIGDQIDECRDASGLFYMLPFQKGFLVNWDIQKNVWDYMFSKECCPVNFTETPLVITEPFFNFPSIQEAMSEIFFEEYECQALLRINAGDLCNYHYQQERPDSLCCLVIDCGYSFTNIVPYIKDKKHKSGIRRIDVGGKLLTNHLKEIISYRQLHVMDETHVVNQAKEDACYVAQDFNREMDVARMKHPENTIVRDYVLPDFTTVRRGYLRSIDEPDNIEQQTLRLNNERFSVPELLFHPSDVGISQMGLAEACVDAVSACPPETHPHLYANVLLVGGCACFPGIRDRLQQELRAAVPDFFDVNVHLPEDPITYAWHGGAKLSRDPDFYSYVVTREEYEEEGHNICFDRFDI